jgi:hypothetical protein
MARPPETRPTLHGSFHRKPAQTVNPVRITVIFGVKMGFPRDAFEGGDPSCAAGEV